MSLDQNLVRDLKMMSVDPGILKKLNSHIVLNDLDVDKLIQQLYAVGWKAHQQKVEFTNPFGQHDGREVKGNTYKVLDTAIKNR